MSTKALITQPPSALKSAIMLVWSELHTLSPCVLKILQLFPYRIWAVISFVTFFESTLFVYLLHIDLAEVAFNRCVTTNEGEVDERRQKVQATTESFTVDYNYEFLEDFHVERSSDRYTICMPE